MYHSWISQTLAIIALASVIVPPPVIASPPKALHQVGRWLVDAQGRVVVLHEQHRSCVCLRWGSPLMSLHLGSRTRLVSTRCNTHDRHRGRRL